MPLFIYRVSCAVSILFKPYLNCCKNRLTAVSGFAYIDLDYAK